MIRYTGKWFSYYYEYVTVFEKRSLLLTWLSIKPYIIEKAKPGDIFFIKTCLQNKIHKNRETSVQKVLNVLFALSSVVSHEVYF